MAEDNRKSGNGIARRSLLGLAAVGGATAGLSILFPDSRVSEVSAPPSTPLPSPTPIPSPDNRYLSTLKLGPGISGPEKIFGRAYSALKILSAVPLTNYRHTSKLHLAVSVVGYINELQIIDPAVGTVIHTLNLPEDSGHGIDSMVWDESRQRLYLSVDGSILTWNPAIPQQFNTLVVVEGASAAYELRLDSNGNLWGGTYPLGASFNYNVTSKKLRVFDRVAKDTDYIRRLALDGRGRIWMGTGSRNPRIFTFAAKQPNAVREIKLPVDVANGFIGSINSIGHYLAVTVSSVSEQLILDTRTMKWRDPITRIWASREISKASSGQFFSITSGRLHSTSLQGMEDRQIGEVKANSILAIIPQAGHILIVSTIPDGILCETFDLSLKRVRAARKIGLTPSAMKIQSLLGHSDGNIYIGGFRANGVAALNPLTGVRWNSGDDEQVINQIEGMVEYNQNKTYIGSYGSADLVLMETIQNGTNRKYDRIARLQTEYAQSRPFGWATNSSSVFFGTVPEYGVSGGVLGKIDPVTDTVSWILNGDGKGFIEGHSIIGLAADESHLYGTTSIRNGYGIDDTKGQAKVFKMHIASRKILWEVSPIASAGALYSPAIIGGWLAIADLQGVALLDLNSGALKKRHVINDVKNTSYRPGWRSADIRVTPDGQKMVHTAAGKVTVMDYVTGSRHSVVSARRQDQFGSRLTVGADGHVYGILNQTALVQFALAPKLT